MLRLVADSGSTKTAWAMVQTQPGQPKVIHTAVTQGLNPLYVTAEEIASALQQVLAEVGEGQPDVLEFYGSGCSGERIALVERALRSRLTPMTQVSVASDLLGAARALTPSYAHTLTSASSHTPASSQATPFIACILGTGAIASLYDPQSQQLTPMPALGYILGDEGSGAWYGKHIVSDYLKGQMPAVAHEAFEEDFGPLLPEQVIRHVYQMPCPNRYLATFATFLARHSQLNYSQGLAYRGVEEFWKRNVMRIDSSVREVRLVGSVAWHLRSVIEQVAAYHDYVVTRVLKDPIEGLV